MPIGDEAEAPNGFVDLCRREAAQCEAGAGETATRKVEPVQPLSFGGSSIAFTPKSLSGMKLARTDVLCGATIGVQRRWRLGNQLGQVLQQISPRSGGQDRCGGSKLAMFTAPIAPVRAQPYGLLALPAKSAPMPLAVRQDRSLALLKRINSDVNRSVIQQNDSRTDGVADRWNRLAAVKNPVGDCEDISIEKRLRLVEAGFPADKLFYAVGYRSGFGLHVVLVARLGQSDVVLDSVNRQVTPWHRLGYRWLRVQRPGTPRSWGYFAGRTAGLADSRGGSSATANTAGAITASR